MRIFIAAAVALLPAAVSAQQIGLFAAKRIIMDGEIISSAKVSTEEVPNIKAFMGGQAVHELYIREDGKLYLCYVATKTEGSQPPQAACFGG